MDYQVGAAVGRRHDAGQHARRPPSHRLAEPHQVPQPVLAGHHRADLVHIQVKRHEGDVVSGGQVAEQARRGQHGVVTGRLQAGGERDEGLDVASRAHRKHQRSHRLPYCSSALPYYTVLLIAF
jgi:hypothetical protein